MSPPQSLRKSVLSLRDTLSTEQRTLKSDAIVKKLFEQEALQNGDHIFTYVNFRSEVVTKTLITRLLTLGKTVSVPITRVKQKRLDIVKITDPEGELVPGYCGIPEPRESIIEAQKVEAGTIDLIVLPGSVFDKRCGRFGYGGGYYDRLLAQVPSATRIALAFDLQIVDKLPLQDHDEVLDTVITETLILQNPSRSRHI